MSFLKILKRKSRKDFSTDTEFSDYEHSVRFPVGVAALIVYFGIFGLILWNDTDLPTPTVSQNRLMFNPNKTYDFLQRLVAIGPRVVGTRQNEVDAVNLLLEEIDKHLEHTSPGFRIERKVEVVSGAYDFGYIKAYRNVKNVVAKIWSGYDTGESILINSHFDSVPGSPGGSDDGVMVAIMMEMFRIFSQWDPLKQDLVFLFNGAEETGLLASHGFIVNDEWATDVKIVVNLEATGVGGKEMLFQTGPDRPNLMQYYKQVKRPHAQVAAEEIFQSEIIPSDTDFRIFRDFGNYIGFDLAYSREGYRYHTKYDNGDVDMGVLQHTGDNMRSLLRALVYDYKFQNRSYDEAGTSVYYDYMGLFLIHYTGTIAIVFNCVAILLAVAAFIVTIVKFGIKLNLQDFKYIALTFLGLIVTYLVSIGVVLLLGTGLDWTNFTMRWYSSSWLVLGLYCVPTILLNFLGIFLLNKFNRKEGFTLGMQTQILLHSNNLLWTLILLVGTALSVRSVYIFLYHVLFSSVASFVILIFKLQNTHYAWKWIYAVFMIIPTTFCFQIAFEVVFLFIPICGRNGGNSNPELLLGAICFFLTFLATCYYLPLLATVRHYVYILAAFLAVFVIFFIIAHTPLTFPYGVSNEPRPQRYTIYHMSRRVRDETSITFLDSGFTFAKSDRNSPAVELEFASETETLEDEICQAALNTDVWIPAGRPAENLPAVELTVLSKTETDNLITFDFHVLGPDRLNIYLSPREGVEAVEIDLLANLPKTYSLWNGRPVYYISFTAGDTQGLKFRLRLQRTDGGTTGSVLDVAIVGEYLHDVEISDEYRKFLDRFPEWAFVNSMVAQCETWVL